MHSDVVVQGAVVSGGVGTERAVPMRHLPLYVPAFVDKGTTLLHLFGGGWADDIVQPDVPVSPIDRVTGIDNLALNTMKDEDHIPALDRPGLGISCGIPIIPFSHRMLSPTSIASGSLLAFRSL